MTCKSISALDECLLTRPSQAWLMQSVEVKWNCSLRALSKGNRTCCKAPLGQAPQGSVHWTAVPVSPGKFCGEADTRGGSKVHTICAYLNTHNMHPPPCSSHLHPVISSISILSPTAIKASSVHMFSPGVHGGSHYAITQTL